MKTTETPPPLSECDNALIQYLKRDLKGKISDIVSIFGWRCEMDVAYVKLPDIAHWMNKVCETYDLLGPSFASPVEFGSMGVIVDAAPNREWALSLQLDCPNLSDLQTWNYWGRIIAVLASRLRMSRVSDLPGYNHDATVGPFGPQFHNQGASQ